MKEVLISLYLLSLVACSPITHYELLIKDVQIYSKKIEKAETTSLSLFSME